MPAGVQQSLKAFTFYVGQVGNLRPIDKAYGNYGPITNRPQDAILRHINAPYTPQLWVLMVSMLRYPGIAGTPGEFPILGFSVRHRHTSYNAG